MQNTVIKRGFPEYEHSFHSLVKHTKYFKELGTYPQIHLLEPAPESFSALSTEGEPSDHSI